MNTKLIKYNELVMNEGGINLQRGMNFGIKGSYSIVLMSVESNAPYADEMLDDGIIKYEGHDQERVSKDLKKTTDQPMANKTGTLTQNGKFFQAADNFKEGRRQAAKIKVYRKIKKGIWVDMGFYDLIDGYIENDGKRNVFKFLLKPNFEKFDPDTAYFVLEGKPVDRIEQFEGYKAQRVYHDTDGFQRQKDIIINLLRRRFPINVVRHPRYECDDVLAAIATSLHKNDKCTVVSSDTDFLQLYDQHKNIEIL